MQISANSFLPKYSHEALSYSFDLLSLYRTKNNSFFCSFFAACLLPKVSSQDSKNKNEKQSHKRQTSLQQR